MGQENDARLLYYHRQPRDRKHVVQLVRESSAFVGIKVGTNEGEVSGLCEEIGDHGLVIWGVGDRSTEAARLVPRSHFRYIRTFAKAGDLINNAQRAGNYEESESVEKRNLCFGGNPFRERTRLQLLCGC